MPQELVALITGGGRGLGKAIALRLAQSQPVLIVGRTEAALKTCCAEILAAGGCAEYVVGDITLPATVAALSDALLRLNWRVSALVLNAGRGHSGDTENYSPALFAEIMALNVNSALPLVQLVLPGMKTRKAGTICFISSTAGLKGLSHDAAYTVSKTAEIGFARALAVEYGKYGISVVPICPGFVESEATDRTITSVARRHGIAPADARARVAKSCPQKRIIPAAELAEVVAFVCSGAVPSLSGSPIVLSGGGL